MFVSNGLPLFWAANEISNVNATTTTLPCFFVWLFVSVGHQIAGLVSQAENQLKAADYAAAVKTVEAGMRLDAGNRDLQAVLDRAKPKYEAAERSRRSGLGKTELLKEKGDDFYKQAAFEVRTCCSSACAV